jgi:anti-sigma-K factor RskA
VPPPLRHPDADVAPVARPERREARTPWWRRSLVPAPALALASVVALAVGVGVGALVVGGDDGSPAPDAVADLRLAAFGEAPSVARGDVRVLDGQQIALSVNDLRPSTAKDFYTAWLLGADGRLVPLGSFKVPASGAASIRLPLPVEPREFDFVDISVEPDDGDPGHSGKSVLRGPTA